MEMTGDDSSFVSMVRRVLLDCGPRIGADLDGVNFAFFCDKASAHTSRAHVPTHE